MSKSYVQPDELTVDSIFKQDFYSIPIYQRSYAWEEDQIEQLITDIYDASDKDKYYLGSLIVDKIEEHKFSVIDGQQRLTTLYLIMAYLKKAQLRKNCLTFEARNESNAVLQELLTYDFSDEEQEFEGDASFNDEIVAGIKIVQSFFRIHSYYKRTVLENLKKVVLIRTQVPQNIDLNHYFEIMNTRGEQLELHEIAKGRILEKLNPQEQKIAAKIWDACSQMNEYVQMCFPINIRKKIFGNNWSDFILEDFDDVKQNFLNMEVGNNQKGKYDSNHYYSLERILTDKKIKSTKRQKDTEEQENERFESIVDFPTFLMIVNEVQNLEKEESSLDDKHFIEKLEHNWSGTAKCKKFLFEMLKMKFLFDNYIIKREFAKDYKDDGKWSLKRLVKVEKENKPKYVSSFTRQDNEDNVSKNLKVLQSGLRITYTSPKTMHWISYALKELNKPKENKISAKNLLKELERYSCKKIKEADYSNAKGFGIERIIFTYLDYILFRDNKSEKYVFPKGNTFKYSDFQFQFRTSIEHFHPQHTIKDEGIEDWNKTIKERNCYLNSLGNLALITVKANSKFSNLSPNSKMGSYRDTLKQSLKFLEMEKLRERAGDWTKECVKEHERAMIDLLDREVTKYFEE